MLKDFVLRYLIYSLVGIFLIIIIFPIYWVLVTSLKVNSQIFTLPPKLLPFPITLEHYRAAFYTEGFLVYFKNSLIVAILSSFFSVFFGSLMSYALVRGNFRWSNTIGLVILGARMIPPIALAIPYFLLLRFYGLLDTHLGLIIVYTGFSLPIAVWMMRGFFMEIPPSIEESAMIDGCSRLGVLFRVVIPLVAHGMAATTVFTFNLSWNEFLYALVLTRTNSSMTVPVAASRFITERGIEWGALSSVTTLAILPMIILTICIQKYIVQGLTFGAVKG